MNASEWTLQNNAERVVSQLSGLQKRLMSADDSGWREEFRGKIFSMRRENSGPLFKLGLIEADEIHSPPTPLGSKVRDLLRGKDGK